VQSRVSQQTKVGSNGAIEEAKGLLCHTAQVERKYLQQILHNSPAPGGAHEAAYR